MQNDLQEGRDGAVCWYVGSESSRVAVGLAEKIPGGGNLVLADGANGVEETIENGDSEGMVLAGKSCLGVWEDATP